MEQLPEFIAHHWQLCALLLILLICVGINEWISQKKRAKAVSTQAAIALINDHDAIVIDLRAQDLFRQGHITGAIHAAEEDFKTHRMDTHKTRAIILVCTRGIQSATLATYLRTQGFTDTVVLAGGISAWQAANLPLVQGK